MDRNELPKVYKGFSTAELLEQLDKISGGVKEELNLPPEMMIAISTLARGYGLTPEARIAARLKREICGNSMAVV